MHLCILCVLGYLVTLLMKKNHLNSYEINSILQHLNKRLLFIQYNTLNAS